MQPYPISLEDELPIDPLPAETQYSENYAFNGFDFQQRIGFIVNIGRWVQSPDKWQEHLLLTLPDGSYLVNAQIGRAADKTIPSGGAMQATCCDAGGKWRIEFDGAMRHLGPDELIQDRIPEKRPVPVRFSATIEHDHPVWMFPRSENTSHGKFHYEQLGRFDATIDFAGERHVFSGPQYRDHSRGPRHLADYQGHVWFQIHFPDRPRFAAYHGWVMGDDGLDHILAQSIGMTPEGFCGAKLLDPLAVKLKSMDDIASTAPITLEFEMDGQRYSATGTPLAHPTYSLSILHDYYHACSREIAEIVAVDHPMLMRIGDQVVPANLQRSMRNPTTYGR